MAWITVDENMYQLVERFRATFELNIATLKMMYENC